MDLLEPSEYVTRCPYKGVARLVGSGERQARQGYRVELSGAEFQSARRLKTCSVSTTSTSTCTSRGCCKIDQLRRSLSVEMRKVTSVSVFCLSMLRPGMARSRPGLAFGDTLRTPCLACPRRRSWSSFGEARRSSHAGLARLPAKLSRQSGDRRGPTDTTWSNRWAACRRQA